MKINLKSPTVFLIMVLIVMVGLTGCDNGDITLENSTLTGDIRQRMNEGDLMTTNGLVVLEKNNSEVDRQYIEYDEDNTSFHFDGLESGEYTVYVYNFNLENEEVKVQLNEGEDLSLSDPIVLEQLDKKRALETTLIMDIDEDEIADENIRLTIASAINKEAIIEKMDEHMGDDFEIEISKRLLTPTRFGFEDIDLTIDYNLEQAKEYREESEFVNEVNIDIFANEESNHRDVVAEEIESQFNDLEQLDINFNTRIVDWENFIELNSVSIIGITGYNPIFIETYVNELDLNDKKINGRTLDEIIDLAKLNQDHIDKVMELLLPVEKFLIDGGYVIPIAYYYEN